MRAAASPVTKGRNCQKLSPGPARRRPCSPCARVVETRRASRTRRGIRSASERALSVSRRPGARSVAAEIRAAAIR
ncbi:hypothetical protein AEGHOMDF_0856 [Methylobacterium soli]|nr:hypothetical protein AEGHOMDF_0856 [Methylobacterium soli]